MTIEYFQGGLSYVVTRSPVLSLVKEEMFANGLGIVVVHMPAKRRFSIACNLARLRGINLTQGDIVGSLNGLEHERGLPEDQRWWGHEDRIGSLKPSGSPLTADDVLVAVRAAL